jgi:hypothetical protein
MNTGRNRGLLLAFGIAAVAVTILAVALPRPANAYDDGGVAFNFPSNWTLHDQLAQPVEGGAYHAILGTVAFDSCEESDLNCYLRQPIEPGQIEVSLRSMFLDVDFCGYFQRKFPSALLPIGLNAVNVRQSSNVRVGGQPAGYLDFVEEGPASGPAEEIQQWYIESSYSNRAIYEIEATVNGTGDATLHGDLERLVASFKFLPQQLTPDESAELNLPSTDDCSHLFPTA